MIAAVALLGACSKTTAPDSSDPFKPLVDKWSAVDPASLSPAPPSLARGRKVMVVFFDPPVAYAPPSPGSCFATTPEEVGIVVLAHSKEEPARLSATGAKLLDTTWRLDAVAIPDGKRIASWSRRATADDTTTKKVGGVTQTVPLSSAGVSVAGFPRGTFNSDCLALQAGTQPD